MTQQMIQALNDVELERAQRWIEDERKLRTEQRRQETIAKIKELARSIEVVVRINGTRGRPPQKRVAISAKKAS